MNQCTSSAAVILPLNRVISWFSPGQFLHVFTVWLYLIWAFGRKLTNQNGNWEKWMPILFAIKPICGSTTLKFKPRIQDKERSVILEFIHHLCLYVVYIFVANYHKLLLILLQKFSWKTCIEMAKPKLLKTSWKFEFIKTSQSENDSISWMIRNICNSVGYQFLFVGQQFAFCNIVEHGSPSLVLKSCDLLTLFQLV